MKPLYLTLAATAILFALSPQTHAEEMIACPAIAKLCPDGSSVSATGPHCEMPACPGEPAGGMVVNPENPDAEINNGHCNKAPTTCPDGSTVQCAPCPGSGNGVPSQPPARK